MFTGIIEKVATITSIEPGPQECKVLIATQFTDLELGESVAINGVCLTVTETSANGDALFYVSPETLECTNLGALEADSRVNLERALKVGDRLSGHWVQGHVDCTAPVTKISKESNAYLLKVRLPQSMLNYCIDKGSISLNGTSLTINRVLEDGQIEIQLIPHTWEHTNFSSLTVDSRVNVEVDMLAKYLERQCRNYKEQLSI